MADHKISIVMPAYNAGGFIEEAISSVVNQSYRNWELLVVNDGSTDETSKIVSHVKDSRISVFEQENKGVSAARNLALQKMTGDYFCFLDADDILPENSLESRLSVFRTDENICFVDGYVEIKNHDLSQRTGQYQPSFKGNPRKELLKLSEKCFFGPSWMIKRDLDFVYEMKENMTHGEDLLFYIEISHQGFYSYTSDCIYIYRRNKGSAMSNLTGLEKGYRKLFDYIKKNNWATKKELFLLRAKIFKIMFLSYLKNKEIINVFRAVRILTSNL